MTDSTRPETVFILGAGISFPDGAPLMNNFFEVAYLLALSHEDLRAQYHLVHKARVALQRIAFKTQVDLYNLESVFVALEMAETLGGFGDTSTLEIGEWTRALRRTIELTIAYSVQFDVDIEESVKDMSRLRLRPSSTMSQFADRLSLTQPDGSPRCAVISFNYDLLLEVALVSKNLQYDYGLSSDNWPRDKIPLLKLHGSLNCLPPCIDGGEIKVADWPDSTAWRATNPIPSKYPLLATGQSGTKAALPLIIPPTDSKLGYRKQITPVWQRAKEVLQNARRVIVIGFSMPPTDDFFRTFFALSTVSDSFIEQFVVIDPSNESAARIRQFLSPALQQRFRHIAYGIERHDTQNELYRILQS